MQETSDIDIDGLQPSVILVQNQWLLLGDAMDVSSPQCNVSPSQYRHQLAIWEYPTQSNDSLNIPFLVAELRDHDRSVGNIQVHVRGCKALPDFPRLLLMDERLKKVDARCEPLPQPETSLPSLTPAG